MATKFSKELAVKPGHKVKLSKWDADDTLGWDKNHETKESLEKAINRLDSFQYRLYDLEMDFCEAGHGYWLTADEDKRVLELMAKEEKNLGRTVLAQDRFAAHLQFLRSGSFIDRLHEWAVDAMDPKTKPKF